MIAFKIPGDPIPLKRHRSFIAKKLGRVIQYNPSSKDQTQFKIRCKKWRPKEPATGPIEITLHFFVKRPKSHYRTGKYKSELKTTAPLVATSKPDLDNYIKFVLDSLQGPRGFFKDDSQVYSIMAEKLYSHLPKTCIQIKAL